MLEQLGLLGCWNWMEKSPASTHCKCALNALVSKWCRRHVRRSHGVADHKKLWKSSQAICLASKFRRLFQRLWNDLIVVQIVLEANKCLQIVSISHMAFRRVGLLGSDENSERYGRYAGHEAVCTGCSGADWRGQSQRGRPAKAMSKLDEPRLMSDSHWGLMNISANYQKRTKRTAHCTARSSEFNWFRRAELMN